MLHHVMSRGNDKREMFIDDEDYAKYLCMLERSAERFGIEVVALCLMPNHVHLLVKPHQHPLSRMMQHLNGSYCGWFNRRHGRVGHVLQGRYKCQIVEGGPSFLRVLRYVVMNPVAARKVAHPADWPWSSYSQAVGLDDRMAFLSLTDIWRAFDAQNSLNAQHAFKTFVEQGVPSNAAPDGLLVGSDGFVRSFESMLAPHRNNREVVHPERFAARPSIGEVIPDRTRGPGFEHAAHRAFQTYAFTLREIAEHVGVSPSAVWLWTQRAARAA
jgi:REP element-mobilizing transposase RayT